MQSVFIVSYLVLSSLLYCYKISGQKLLFFLLKLNLSYNNKNVVVQDRFTRKIQNEFTWGGRRKTDRMTCKTDGITGVI